MDYRSRQKNLVRSFSPFLDALIVTHLPNVRYLCGFTGSSGVLVLSQRNSVLFTDGRYREQTTTEVKSTKVVISNTAALSAAAGWIADHRLGKIGIEAEHISVSSRSALTGLLPRKTRIRNTRALVEELRMIKDADELQLMRNAAQLGSSLLQTALRTIRNGVSELEVAAEMEYDARQKGAEAMSFDTIVASGARSALPHGRATSVKIANGFVVLDFGVILAGYCSDKTRTVYVGKPQPKERKWYEAVRDAQQAAIETVRDGIPAAAVDAAARSVLRSAKLDRYFTHSTGHGVGIEIHEPPRIGRNQEEPLRSGMIITIEPGVYVTGVGGIRIEDMVVVTDRGCEVLWPAGKELVLL